MPIGSTATPMKSSLNSKCLRLAASITPPNANQVLQSQSPTNPVRTAPTKHPCGMLERVGASLVPRISYSTGVHTAVIISLLNRLSGNSIVGQIVRTLSERCRPNKQGFLIVHPNRRMQRWTTVCTAHFPTSSTMIR